MHLPPEAIHEFRAIWRDEYDEELPFERARLVAERFLSTFHVLYIAPMKAKAKASTATELDGPSTQMT